jgi:hypothetical protein
VSAVELGELLARDRPRFSICTLVTKPDEYAAMQASFRAGGFTEPACEFIFADNSRGNQFDAYAGYNAFLAEARGEYVIICHQDVVLLQDGREVLDARLAELSAIDPLWAVCGNAGRSPDGSLIVRITSPYGDNERRGTFPGKVVGLDENFIVVRRSANLGVPPRFTGFHLPATALCAAASDMGMNCYAIDFHLHHKSAGKIDDVFYKAMRGFAQFRTTRARPALVGATTDMAIVTASPMVTMVANRLLKSRLQRVALWIVKPTASP